MTSFTWDFYTRSILSDDPFENGRQKTFLRDAKYIFEEARLIKERSPEPMQCIKLLKVAEQGVSLKIINDNYVCCMGMMLTLQVIQ